MPSYTYEKGNLVQVRRDVGFFSTGEIFQVARAKRSIVTPESQALFNDKGSIINSRFVDLYDSEPED